MPDSWFKRNGRFLNLFFGAITSFSLLFALYVFNQSEKLSELTYHTLQEKIFDPSGIEGVSAVYSGKSFYSGVLQKITITIWNSGRKSLDIGDVRQKLTLRGDGFKIIDAKIGIQNPEFAGFRIDKRNDLDTIEWDFFDAGYFFVVDLFVHSDSMDAEPALALEATNFSGLVDYCRSFPKFAKVGTPILAFIFFYAATAFFLVITMNPANYLERRMEAFKVVKVIFQAVIIATSFAFGISVALLILNFIPIYFFNYYDNLSSWLEFIVDIPIQINNISCEIR